MEKFEKNASYLIKIITIIPFLGVVLSFCYETFFFWGLGGRLSHYFDTIDFVKSSLFFVAPIVLFLIVVELVFPPNFENDITVNEEKKNPQEKILKSVDKFMVAVFLLLILAGISVFTLYGKQWALFVVLYLTFVTAIVFNIIKFKDWFVNQGISRTLISFALMCLLTVCIFGFMMGTYSKISSPNSPNVIVHIETAGKVDVKEYFFIRRLASGLVVIDTESKMLTYLNHNIVRAMEFNITPKFKGILTSE